MAFSPQAAGAKKPGASGKWLQKKFGAPAAPQAPAGAPFPAHAAPFQQPPPHGVPPQTPPHPGAPPPPPAAMHPGAPPQGAPPIPGQPPPIDPGPHAMGAAPPPGGQAPQASTGPQYGGKGPYMLAKDHVAATNVPPGGASCKNCIYLSKDGNACGNAFFIRWNGGNPELPAPAESYCSDWWEHATGVMNDGDGSDAPTDSKGQPIAGAGGPAAMNAASKVAPEDGKPPAGAPGEAPIDPEHVKRAFGPRDASGGQVPNAPGGPVQGKGQLPPVPGDVNAPDDQASGASAFAKKFGKKKPSPVKPPPSV